ncbi:MAG: hypothetical protein FJW35_06470 [Acidobacteria bacterium]|nr:hypothetical protein [Acidobacteriota bacterium]
MATKKTDTGIFQRADIIDKPTKAELRRTIQAAKRDTTEGTITQYEKTARRILRKHGIRDWPTTADTPDSHAALLSAIMRWLEACQKHPGDMALQDAGFVLNEARYLRRALAVGKADAAAAHSLRLATVGLRLEIRPYEPAARTGEKVRRATAKGRQSPALAAARERRHAQHLAWARYATEYRGRNPDHSANQIAAYAARHFGANFSTVKKALRKIVGKV